MNPILVTLLVVLGPLAIYLTLSRKMREFQEPPEAPTWPVIGHIVGLMRSKFNYYVTLSQKVSQPVFTVSMPGQRMYVVTSIQLIQTIQKQPKTLAFPPIEAKFASQVCGVSKEAHAILMQNVNGDEGHCGLSMESYEGMRTALKPGEGLDKMNRAMIQEVASCLDELANQVASSSCKKGLSSWLRDVITSATTNSVYGPENPFKDKAVVDGFWQFEHDLMTILIGIAPSIMARKGLAGRAKVSAAFENYYRKGGHNKASILTKNRYEVSFKNGVPIADIARYEVGGSIAILVNTAPSAFWMLILIYSHPELLCDLRQEIGSMMLEKTDKSGKTRIIDITSLKSSCPLLTSTFQEVLRYRSVGTSVREVMEDTVIDGQWLLKKGNMIQMPSRVLHCDADIWGLDVHEFKPERFLKSMSTAPRNSKTPPAAAFRAFGGGSTLCPGRHFATNEVLAVVTMFIMRFDMEPLDGTWTLPTSNNTNVASVVMEPDSDVEVTISERRGLDSSSWAFGLKDSEDVFAIVAEDRMEWEQNES